VQGARPLFFLDYIATGRLLPETIGSIIEGITGGCRENGCVLLGGETAEMPGFYEDGEYDMAGFIVGVVERRKIIDGKRISRDDVVLALPSSGLHTNGYSLARKLFLDIAGYNVNTTLDEVGMTVGEALLQPHVSYLRVLTDLLETNKIKGLAHITGGGMTDNIPRILPEGTAVEIRRGTWPVLPIFDVMQALGSVPEAEMFRSFNMGVGMVIICSEQEVKAIQAHFTKLEQDCYEIGRVISGNRSVSYS